MRTGKTALVMVGCLKGGGIEQKRKKKEKELMDMDTVVGGREWVESIGGKNENLIK